MTRRITRRRSARASLAPRSRAQKVARPRLAVVVIRGFDSFDPVLAGLRREFGGKVRFTKSMPRRPDTAVAAVLLERLHNANPSAVEAARSTATGRAHVCSSIPASWCHGEIMVGPLEFPDRAGCGWCALERRRAVAEGVEGRPGESVGEPGSDPLPAEVSRWLAKEIRVLLRGGRSESQLLGQVWRFHPSSGTWTPHRVIPLPECPRCGGAGSHEMRGDGETLVAALGPEQSPEELLGRLGGWVDPTLGIISRIYIEDPEERGMAMPVVATAAPPFVRDRSGVLRRLPLGWGKGLTISGALLSAIGEAIERYAPSLPDHRRIRWCRLRELSGEILDPREVPLYRPAQYRRPGFPFVPFDPDVVHPWVDGHWIGTGQRVWVPAVFAFLSMDLEVSQHFCQGTSNGLAASTDAEEGQLRAALELIERDAFMTAWLTGCPCPRLDFGEALEPGLGEILDGLEAMGAAVEARVLPTARCGTAIVCLAVGDGTRYPGITLGLGADLDPVAALRQAILELGQTGPHLRRLMRTGVVATPASASAVREMLDHAAYYFRPDRREAFEAMRRGTGRVTLADLKANRRARSLKDCAAALSAAGVRVAVVNVASADVATGPFQVWRAVSPDLQPISYGFGLDRQRVRGLRPRRGGARSGGIHPIW
ncbi:MAG: TOMM precursor leader peptide-binding protein [Verrucomicrobiales bacterium]|nr:TOMM precursor leader peptide-binding protein [Verrucomicrobiales bacterium]